MATDQIMAGKTMGKTAAISDWRLATGQNGSDGRLAISDWSKTATNSELLERLLATTAPNLPRRYTFDGAPKLPSSGASENATGCFSAGVAKHRRR
jgi:hypothetical protein